MADEQQRRWLPVHHGLHAIQRRMTALPIADEILGNLQPDTLLRQSVLVENIRRHDWRFTVSSTGRVFNALTGLKRELRGAIRLDGQPICGVDIRCAQPALLAILMQLSAGGDVPTYIQRLLDTGPATDEERSVLPVSSVFLRVLAGDCPSVGSDADRFRDLVLTGDQQFHGPSSS